LILNLSGRSLLNHLIRPLEERRQDRQTECLGGLEIDDQLELGWLFDRQFGGLRALENPVYINRGALCGL
jgi:hypothetical protein